MADLLELLHERMLITRCQAGDAKAFEEIVERYQNRLRFFVRKLLVNSHSVDDLLQDVWVDVFRSIGKLRDPVAFPAWLYRIARDKAYGELRRRERVAIVPMTADTECAASADETKEEFSAEEVSLVYQCLDQLRPEHREVLVLRFLETMDYETIAEVVGCNVGTVRSRLHYAKKTLQSLVKGQDCNER